jgi:large subunit ribosomal protein L10
MKKEDKKIVIQQLADTLNTYGNFYLTDIEALNAEKTSELRRACFKKDIKLVVVKNTLLKKALSEQGADFSPLYEALSGNTAVMFSNVVNAPAHLIQEFTQGGPKKGETKPALKAAYVQESFYVGAHYLDALVHLKGKNELLADILGLLQSPIQNVVSSLASGGQTIHGILKTLEER